MFGFVLRSYLNGQWRTPTDDGRPLLDAATGGEVARVSGDGLDYAAALDYARTVGGPALRDAGFRERPQPQHCHWHVAGLGRPDHRTGACRRR